jgi:Cdc6-like AAA superfamily ATPase
MKINELEDSEVQIKLPKISCDGLISSRIPHPLPNTSFFMAVIGTPGSGKSSTAISLLTAKGMQRCYRKAFHHVYIVCPQHSLHSYANDPFKNHSKDKIFHDLNEQTLGRIEERLEETSLQDETSLIFLDDCAIALRDKQVQRSLNRICANRRHLRCSIIIIAQAFRYMPLSTRRLISCMIFFKPGNKKELDTIHEEMLSHIDKDDFYKLAKYAFQDRHDHMMVCVNTGQVYRNFNTLELTEN